MSEAAIVTKKPGRSDPRRRRRDGASAKFAIKNAEPGYKYCWVYKNTEDQGVEYYESIGWDIVRATPNGVSSGAGKVVKDGSVMEQGGYVLMSISQEDWDDLQQVGADGDTGQDLFDKIEKKIIDPRGGMDPARGMSSRYFQALNTTKPNQMRRGNPDVVTD